MTPDEIAAKISQRRRQVLVHSIIYYRFDENIVPDHKWMQWAQELVALQQEHPALAAQCPLAKEFEGWTGESGFQLPMADPYWVGRAQWLIEVEKRKRRSQ